MGLTFHYSARIRQLEQIATLTKEVQDICHSMNWKYNLWDDLMDISANIAPKEQGEGKIYLRGISFTPPDCETVSFVFTPSGKITAVINIMFADSYPDPDMIYTVHVKSQYAGSDLHIALIKLLKYLEKKYLTDMEVLDEGDYWETMDEIILAKKFEDNWKAINAVSDALKNIPFDEDLDVHSLTDQIAKILKGKLES